MTISVKESQRSEAGDLAAGAKRYSDVLALAEAVVAL
jgi:hypothetical protein